MCRGSRESGVLSAPEEPLVARPGGLKEGALRASLLAPARGSWSSAGAAGAGGGVGGGRGAGAGKAGSHVLRVRPRSRQAVAQLGTAFAPACRGPAAWSRARHLSPAPPPRRLRSEQNLQRPSRGFCEETSGHVLAGPGIEASAQKFHVNNGDGQHEPPPIARPRGRGVTPLCGSALRFVLWAGHFRSLCPGPISSVHSFLTWVLPGGPARSLSWGTWPYRSP